MAEEFQLNVNGRRRAVTTDGERPLLDALREDLQLTGAKYGCGEGQCGACTVLIDGKAVRSCITTIGEIGEAAITTIEGLAIEGGELHPVQQAFIDKQGLQCGYCVPGQILSAVALLKENAKPSREEIVEALDGNICRCCNYVSILAAVEYAAATPGGNNDN
jgi:aerobic-type carbon monoxide dehydrogenase small subunit (CoxS/CutS family)